MSEVSRFKRWIVANGGEALAPTNPYELFRFASAQGVGVVYRNKAGSQTWTGAAADLRPVFHAGNSVRLAPKIKARHADNRYSSLIERDGGFCWFGCGCEMTVEAATIEHLCSRTHGGPDHIANLVLACEPCNLAAGHLSVSEKVVYRDQQVALPSRVDSAFAKGMLS